MRQKSHDLTLQDVEKAAKALVGCTGADIENLVNLIALQTVRMARINHKIEACIHAEHLEDGVRAFMEERKK